MLEVTERGLKNVQKVVQSIVQEELKFTQNTIQTEMKSYPAVVPNTCAAAFSQKKISCAAVKSATDSADRSQNIVIYDVQEVEN